jgi:hypothetical protein
MCRKKKEIMSTKLVAQIVGAVLALAILFGASGFQTDL